MESTKGKIKISSEADRIAVAAVLIKNGYTVMIQKEKAGNRYEYFVVYSR